MIAATITINDEEDHLRPLFAAEEQRLLNGRASYEVTRRGSDTTITAKAEDATALRALLNSACKALIVYEKTKRTTR
ncbi:hypothetical protein JXA12_05315 [Candidatus Woesearchaeota archaeon]|nr:hypothetical protein [Candidatus Woesearchaeota archaeon]